MGLGLEKLRVGSFPGVAPAGRIRIALMGDIPGTCGLGQHARARASHTRVHVTPGDAGSVPVAGRPGCRQKANPAFFGVPAGFSTDKTPPRR